MSMIYLANAHKIEDMHGINFITPHEHVAVDFPRDEVPHYVIWSYVDKSDVSSTNDFATAMDTAARWLKRAEPA